MKTISNQLERLMSKVRKTDSCWLWTASKNRSGYGQFGYWRNGKCIMTSASRVIWELLNGPIPKDLCVLHKCDIRHCVNPAHLYLGTRLDNSNDMINRGRAKHPGVPGPAHPHAKFTWQEIKEIRSLYKTGKFSQRSLAKRFHIQLSTLQDIINMKSYVNPPRLL